MNSFLRKSSAFVRAFGIAIMTVVFLIVLPFAMFFLYTITSVGMIIGYFALGGDKGFHDGDT